MKKGKKGAALTPTGGGSLNLIKRGRHCPPFFEYILGGEGFEKFSFAEEEFHLSHGEKVLLQIKEAEGRGRSREGQKACPHKGERNLKGLHLVKGVEGGDSCNFTPPGGNASSTRKRTTNSPRNSFLISHREASIVNRD